MFDFDFVFFETWNVFLINFLVYCFDFINFENFFYPHSLYVLN